MRKKGSVTVFLTLILSLLLSLICASIESVRMASARTQILNGMDIGLYSLFGQYDKELLTDYDLFALDGSRGGGQLDLAAVCDELEAYMNPVLKQNSQKLTLCQSGLTGYRLLTDQKGEAFYQQIVGYLPVQLLTGTVVGVKNGIKVTHRDAPPAAHALFLVNKCLTPIVGDSVLPALLDALAAACAALLLHHRLSAGVLLHLAPAA